MRPGPGRYRLDFYGSNYRGSLFLAVSSAVREQCNTSLHEGNWRVMTVTAAERFFDLDLWFAAAGHFAILAASFQVPYRLRWKEDLQQLMPFNRKLLW